MLDARQALGGRMATSHELWIALFVPTLFIVLVREANSEFPSWLVVLGMGVIENLAAAVVLAIFALTFRARFPVFPLPLVFVLAATAGVARGLTGGLVVASWTTGDPQFLGQIATWVSISVIWVPLVSYALAQFDHRRVLLAELESQNQRIAVLREAASMTSEQWRARLLGAVRDSIGPVVAEIREGLAAVGAGLNSASLRSMGEHLTSVSEVTEGLVHGVSAAPVEDPRHRLRAPARFALDFGHARPLLAGGLVGLLLFSALVPEAIRVGGTTAGITIGVSVVVVTIVLSALGLGLAAMARKRPASRVALPVLAYLLAGLAGTATALSLDRLTPHPTIGALIAAEPLAVLIAAAFISSAVGLGTANREVVDRLAVLAVEQTQLSRRASRIETKVREQLSVLLHGPVLSRLSACSMALNFFASEDSSNDPARSEFIGASVLNHLDAVSRDLELLAEM